MRKMMLRINVSYVIGPATQTRSGRLFFFLGFESGSKGHDGDIAGHR
jgi:hypothetical protein